MVQDSEGRWWAKHRKTGEWNYHDGETWVRGTPPGYEEVVPETVTDGPPAQPSATPHPEVERGENRWGRRPSLLVAGLAGVVALIAVAVWFLGLSGTNADTVSVPSITGQTLEEARQTEGDRFEIVADVSGADPDDVIIEQHPLSGEQAERGSEISVTLGPSDQRFVSVPDVTGMNETEARETLEDTGLTLNNVYKELNDSVPAGQVIRQSPLPDSQEQPLQGVDVTISTGQE